MAGPGAARLMDTLLGILRRAALIDESQPDRGYAAIDRTRVFCTQVGRRVGGSRIYIEQIAAILRKTDLTWCQGKTSKKNGVKVSAYFPGLLT